MTKPRHQASPVALDLIKRFEGYRRFAAPLPDGRWVIGYGHTRTARAGAEVSEADAEALLIYDLMAIAEAIDEVMFSPLTQNQVDALASFAFNIGQANFRRSSVVRRINAGQMIEAAFALEIWRKADFEGERIVLDALVRRRAAEKALFLTPQEGWIAASSAEIEPKADFAMHVAAPDGPTAPTLDEDAPSAVEQAAANLAARLEALAPAEAEPLSAPPLEPDDAPQTEPEPFPAAASKPVYQPPVASVAETESEAEPAPFAAPYETATIASNGEALRRRIFGIAEPRPRIEPGAYVPLLLLGAAGLAIFVAAVILAFRSKPTDGVITALNVGVVIVGLIGILCVASAVYFLLERLADREP